MNSIRTIIIGAPGYSGAELAGILLRHPHAEIVGLFGSARRGGDGSALPQTMADLHPHFRGLLELPILPADTQQIAALSPQAVFLCTPHEASIDLAAELLALPHPPAVFDLSGAFRLSAAQYPRFYGFEHHRPDLLARAVYGLPELNRGRLKAAELVAVPGCYPTSAILPIAPLARAAAIRAGARPIVDSTSGVSGAGRTPTAKTHFCEVSLQPYNVLQHRHNPEIDLHSGIPVVFTPHLGPFDRGILSTIHIELAAGQRWTHERVSEALRDAYADEPFVRLLPSGQWPSVAAVRSTNFCDIAWAVDEAHDHLIVVSAIDNLVKGAAGQAVQCLNIHFGMPETTALHPASDRARL